MTRIRPGRTNALRFPREEEFVGGPNKQLQRTVEQQRGDMPCKNLQAES